MYIYILLAICTRSNHTRKEKKIRFSDDISENLYDLNSDSRNKTGSFEDFLKSIPKHYKKIDHSQVKYPQKKDMREEERQNKPDQSIGLQHWQRCNNGRCSYSGNNRGCTRLSGCNHNSMTNNTVNNNPNDQLTTERENTSNSQTNQQNDSHVLNSFTSLNQSQNQTNLTPVNKSSTTQLPSDMVNLLDQAVTDSKAGVLAPCTVQAILIKLNNLLTEKLNNTVPTVSTATLGKIDDILNAVQTTTSSIKKIIDLLPNAIEAYKKIKKMNTNVINGNKINDKEEEDNTLPRKVCELAIIIEDGSTTPSLTDDSEKSSISDISDRNIKNKNLYIPANIEGHFTFFKKDQEENNDVKTENNNSEDVFDKLGKVNKKIEEVKNRIKEKDNEIKKLKKQLKEKKSLQFE